MELADNWEVYQVEIFRGLKSIMFIGVRKNRCEKDLKSFLVSPYRKKY